MKHVLNENPLSAVERQTKRTTMDDFHLCCFGMVSFTSLIE